MRLSIPISTHEVLAYPEGEGLRFTFTWHKSILVPEWTFAQIEKAIEEAINDNNYIVAERRFIRAMGHKPRGLGA